MFFNNETNHVDPMLISGVCSKEDIALVQNVLARLSEGETNPLSPDAIERRLIEAGALSVQVGASAVFWALYRIFNYDRANNMRGLFRRLPDVAKGLQWVSETEAKAWANDVIAAFTRQGLSHHGRHVPLISAWADVNGDPLKVFPDVVSLRVDAEEVKDFDLPSACAACMNMQAGKRWFGEATSAKDQAFNSMLNAALAARKQAEVNAQRIIDTVLEDGAEEDEDIGALMRQGYDDAND